jgi:hypothetical protein
MNMLLAKLLAFHVAVSSSAVLTVREGFHMNPRNESLFSDLFEMLLDESNAESLGK